MVTVEILAATKKYILIILYPVNTLMVKGSHQIPSCNIKKKTKPQVTFWSKIFSYAPREKKAEKLGT